jgi:hypothetical protein
MSTSDIGTRSSDDTRLATVSRALDVLEVFTADQTEWSLGALSEKTGIA